MCVVGSVSKREKERDRAVILHNMGAIKKQKRIFLLRQFLTLDCINLFSSSLLFKHSFRGRNNELNKHFMLLCEFLSRLSHVSFAL